MKANEFFVFCKGNNNDFVFGYPFQDKGFSGEKNIVLKKALKKHPELSFQLQTLIINEIPFFYDKILNVIRIIGNKNVDILTVKQYIDPYLSQFKNNETAMNDLCKTLDVSDFRPSIVKEKFIIQIAEFLADKGIEI